jgi:hypothetical protein
MPVTNRGVQGEVNWRKEVDLRRISREGGKGAGKGKGVGRGHSLFPPANQIPGYACAVSNKHAY